METVLADLQAWYVAQCDGEWEHCYGMTIGTMDNPGWSVTIELTETLLEGKEFAPVKTEEVEGRWADCRVKDKKFVGYGGPQQLEQLLTIFLDWAKTEPDWLTVPCETEAQTKTREDSGLWAVLGEEVGPELCRAPGCAHLHVKYSAFCRAHHFEMMRGYCYAAPESGLLDHPFRVKLKPHEPTHFSF